MARAQFVIVIGLEKWRIGCTTAEGVEILDLPAGDDAGTNALAAAEELRRRGYRAQGVIVAPPAEWCLCGSVSTLTLPRKNPRSALLYRFEEKLPVAMEDVVADLARHVGGLTSCRVLGVAVQLSKLQVIVEALEQAGITVEMICPAVLLALAKMQDQLRDCELLIWDDQTSRHLFVMCKRYVQDWHLLTLEPQELELNLAARAACATAPLSVMIYSDSDDLKHRLAEMPDVRVIGFESRQLLQTASAASTALLRGKQPPLINLRRNGLAATDSYRHIRSPLTAALLSCIAFLLVSSLVMLQRSRRYEQIAERLEDNQRQVFHRLWPGQAAPTSIKSRLISEEGGLRGLSGDATPPGTPPSALVLFHETLRQLPKGMRFRVLEIRCGSEGIYLEGEARSHGDADAIAAALRKAGSFKIDGPRTEQLAGQGVSFTITAGYVPSPRADSLALQSHEKK